MYSLSFENIECFTHVACSSVNGVEQDCFKRPAWRTWLHVKRVYKLLNKFFLLEIQGNCKISTEASTVPGVNPEAANEDQVTNSSFCKLHLQTSPWGDCWSRGIRNPRFVRNSLNIKSGSDVKIYLFHLVSLHFLFQVYFPPAFFPLVVVLFFCAFFGFVLVKLLPLSRDIFIFISLFHFCNRPLPLWAFPGIIKQIIQMEPNMVRDPNRGGKPDGYFANVAEDLNSGLLTANRSVTLPSFFGNVFWGRIISTGIIWQSR